MITKSEIEKMVEDEAENIFKGVVNPFKRLDIETSFKSGASFVDGILMPEIEKLEKEIDRVIDVADGNSRACIIAVEENFKAKAEIEGLKDVERYLICPSCGVEGYVKDIKVCSDAIRIDLDKKDSDIRLLEKELSEAHATIQSLKDEIEDCKNLIKFYSISDVEGRRLWSESCKQIQSLKDECKRLSDCCHLLDSALVRVLEQPFNGDFDVQAVYIQHMLHEARHWKCPNPESRGVR